MLQKVYILLGSNLGDAMKNLSAAKEQIALLAGQITQSSSIYQTAAWGKTDQNDFLNQVIGIETQLEPVALLNLLLQIETGMGRIRNQKWEPRMIDLDILFYEDLILTSDKLIIPHPAIGERRFVLEPLCEIQSEFKHPVSLKTIRQLLDDCTDASRVEKIVPVNP